MDLTKLSAARKTYFPVAYGVEMWLDEGGRLFLADPSRFDTDYPELKRQGAVYPIQPLAPVSFVLPVGDGSRAIRFEYRFTIKTKRIFEATSVLTASELKRCQLALWSNVVGRYQAAS